MNRSVSSQLVMAVAATTFVVVGFAANPSAALEEGNRFSMQRTENGVVRLDTQTGAMSLCEPQDGTWACARIADGGLEAELRNLREDNKKLRDQLAELRIERDGRSLDRPSQRGDRRLPDEKDVDRAFTFLESVIRRFKGMVDDLKDESKEGTPL